MFGVAAIMPVCWVVWAGVMRGGISYRMTGISLVGANGRRPGRLRCASRALVVWLPALAAASFLWWGPEMLAWADDEPDVGWMAPLLIAWSLYLMGTMLMLVVYILLALVFPRRNVHDVLAGTLVVPR